MILLVILVAAFAIVHAAPSHDAVGGLLRARGGKAFGPLYGILSFLLLALMIWAFRRTDSVVIYDVPDWGRYANFVLSLLGFISLGIFLFRGSWRRVLRYPMALAVLLWAAGHLLANGDARSLVFFGGLAATAVVQALLMARSGKDVMIDSRPGHNFLSFMAGLAIYGLMTQLHLAIAGVPLVELR